jgi:hypothetical protein
MASSGRNMGADPSCNLPVAPTFRLLRVYTRLAPFIGRNDLQYVVVVGT